MVTLSFSDVLVYICVLHFKHTTVTNIEDKFVFDSRIQQGCQIICDRLQVSQGHAIGALKVLFKCQL